MTSPNGAFYFVFAGIVLLSTNATAQPRLATEATINTNTLQTGSSGLSSPEEIDPDRASRPNAPNLNARTLRGNPLWAIPLRSLSATSERPIFLPSRRPPAPPTAGPPPAEPIRPPLQQAESNGPRLTLVGAVTGEREGLAVFLDQTDQTLVRLRTGEDHRGWVLRSVEGRKVRLQNNQEIIVVAFPAPNEGSAAPVSPGMYRSQISR